MQRGDDELQFIVNSDEIQAAVHCWRE